MGHASALTANRTVFPARTSLKEAGKNKNNGVRRLKKDIHGFFFFLQSYFGWSLVRLRSTELTQLKVSSVGAAVCPSKGSQLLSSFLLLRGISQPFYLVFTANSAKACANSRLLTGDSLVPHPWGEMSDCGEMQMVNREIPQIQKKGQMMGLREQGIRPALVLHHKGFVGTGSMVCVPGPWSSPGVGRRLCSPGFNSCCSPALPC